MSIIIKGGNSSDLAAVKPASTAPIPTDPALVVSISPNSPSQSVSITNFPGTQPVSGSVSVSNFPATQPVSGAISVSNFPATQMVIQQTLTKGTQGATGVSNQDLKDSGRNLSTLFMTVPIITTATDTLQSLTGYKSGTAVVATTTPAVVTSGKIYRITSISLTYVAIVTAGSATFTLRANTGGVVAISSPAINNWTLGGPAAVAGVSQTVNIDIPDGLEFAAGTGIGISMIGRGATQTAAAVGYGLVSINGFEY